MRKWLIAAGAILAVTAVAAYSYQRDRSPAPGTLAEAPADLPKADRSFCDSQYDLSGYLDADRLQNLRQKYERKELAGAFLNLQPDQAPVVSAALGFGVNGPVFGARIVRTLAIVDALSAYNECKATKSDCSPSALITHLKTDDPKGPNFSKSWQDLQGEWVGFRNQEINAAKICMTN
jgi:hypothetical protein